MSLPQNVITVFTAVLLHPVYRLHGITVKLFQFPR